MKILKLLFIAAVLVWLIRVVGPLLGLAMSDTADDLLHMVFLLLWGASVFIQNTNKSE